MKKPSEIFEELTHHDELYSIQAITNLGSIIRYGLLSYEKAGNYPHETIAMNPVQERRESKWIPGGMKLHQYVNLYFDAWNPMLSARRDLNEDICILIIDDSVLDFRDAVISDRNAASDYALFYIPSEGLEKLDFDTVYMKNWNDDDRYSYMIKKSKKCAEVLIPYRISSDLIRSVLVYNNQACKKVRIQGYEGEVDINPGCFF